MSESGSQSRVGIGVSSVLMVLVVLAMAALGVLAYSSTRATESMTRRNVQVAERYYQAAAQIQERLQAIDQAALEKPRPCEDELAWYQSQGIPDVEWSQEAESVGFTVTVGEGQTVVAKGVMLPGEGERYKLLSHRMENGGPSEEADDLNLMGV